MSVLPTLRMLVRPEPGLGLDARLPMGKHLRCSMALEAYCQGGSAIYFGLESSRFPFLQIQLVPRARLTLRIPVLGVTEFKSIFAGGSLTLYNQGSRPKPAWGGWKPFWHSIKPFAMPVIELQHRNTLLGSVFDSEQRKALKEALDDVTLRRKERMQEKVRNRRETLGRFEPLEMPKLDPRNRVDAIDRLREKMREQYGDRGVVRGDAIERLRDDSDMRREIEGMMRQRERWKGEVKGRRRGVEDEPGFVRVFPAKWPWDAPKLHLHDSAVESCQFLTEG